MVDPRQHSHIPGSSLGEEHSRTSRTSISPIQNFLQNFVTFWFSQLILTLLFVQAWALLLFVLFALSLFDISQLFLTLLFVQAWALLLFLLFALSLFDFPNWFLRFCLYRGEIFLFGLSRPDLFYAAVSIDFMSVYLLLSLSIVHMIFWSVKPLIRSECCRGNTIFLLITTVIDLGWRVL